MSSRMFHTKEQADQGSKVRIPNIKCKRHSLWAIRRRRLKAVGEMRSSIGVNWQDINWAALARMASSPAYYKRTSV